MKKTLRRKPSVLGQIQTQVERHHERLWKVEQQIGRVDEIYDSIGTFNGQFLQTKNGTLTAAEQAALQHMLRREREEATRSRIEIHAMADQAGHVATEHNRHLRVIARFMKDFLALPKATLKPTTRVSEMKAFAKTLLEYGDEDDE